MTPVNDPALLAQLNGVPPLQGGMPATSGMTPVTDPAMIAQLEGGGQMPTNPSFLPRVVNDVTAGLAQGGQGLHNFLSRALTPILGKYAPAQTNINFGQTFGVNAPNLGDRLLQSAAPYAGYAATAAESLPVEGLGLGARVAQQALAGGLYGGTQSANPALGADIGMLTGGASEAIPGVIGSAGNAINAIQPQRLSDQIMQGLSGGRSLEQNAQSLAQDIQQGFGNRVAQGQALYNPVFNQLGENQIYPMVNPQAGSQYLNLDADIPGSYDRKLTGLHQQFLDNPTLQNAHNLQSQLGTSIRKLQGSDMKGNLSIADRSTMQGYQQAQQALKGDMATFLGNVNPQLGNQYQLASAHWAQNVAPYLENPKVTQIAKGDVTNPANVTNLFKNPEPETQQIVNDMGDQVKNKILYAELGKGQNNMTPEKLVAGVANLDKKGLSSYITPQFQQQIDQLGSRITARNNTQKAAGLLAGTAVGAHIGLPYAEPIGALLGAGIAPTVAKLGQFLPSGGNALSTALQGTNRYAYQPLSKAVAANLINRGGQ